MISPATQMWLCGKKSIRISMSRPLILGILNVTPDSFSDGGKFAQTSDAVRQGILLLQSADGVDVGGESTRPGAEGISAKEERARVIPVLKELRKEMPTAFLSVDTYKAEVAKAAIGEAGVEVVNDVGGGAWDPGMWEAIASTGVGYVCMHAGGKPKEMQKNPSYQDVVKEVGDILMEKLGKMTEAGISQERVVLDVGIGFGKSTEHNRALLEADWIGLCRPLLWGLSRKSFLATTQLEKKLKERDEALDWWHRELLRKGGGMVWRVHDPERVRKGAGLR
jgi:dihydropteroate synthase